MRKTSARCFEQMELEGCKDECKCLIRYNHCMANNCPKEYCPPMPVPIPPDYAKILMRKWEMAKKSILPHALKMTLKTYYPLPVHQPPVPPPPEILPCSSPLPCNEPESSGDDQTDSDSLREPADGQEEERLEIALVVLPDMTVEILLEPAELLGGHCKIVPKRKYSVLKSSSASTRLEEPGEPHLEMDQSDVNGLFTLTVRRS